MSTIKVDTIQDSDGLYNKQQVVQVVNVTDGAVATGTTAIVNDDTIGQNTEGDQYMSRAITPKSATNILKIEVVIIVSHSILTARNVTYLFQDSTANALACAYNLTTTATVPQTTAFSHYMVAGTTSATTFKVRAGSNVGGTMTFNGQSGSRTQGGVLASSITITEYQPS